MRVVVRGAVQGVGFRPFVYRLATELALTGWVENSSAGVQVEVEGAPSVLDDFLRRLEDERPPRASVQSLEHALLDPVGYDGFQIRDSDGSGPPTVTVLPDIATCPDCLRELFDPSDRRFRYPFTNCTNCGPRFSIIQALPYDRAHTTMRGFVMCARCQAEYDDPRDRRFHAQPNACPACGPRLQLRDARGAALDGEPLPQAVAALRAGRVVAVQGIGGFHLMVDARNEEALGRLRRAKHRDEKPFAVLFPTLEAVRAACAISALEERLLRSPEAPIVLLQRRDDRLAPSVAPRNPYLGVMLPSNPLHHLLMAELAAPVVATSGNRSDEPMCTEPDEAVGRLAGIAELFLIHDRPIARRIDDSIVREIAGRAMVLRRARGYAPLPLEIGAHGGSRAGAQLPGVLAVGGHVKGAAAAAIRGQVFVTQHLGDLETAEATAAFEEAITSFERLYAFRPAVIACDVHPDYRSTQIAARLAAELTPGGKPVRVQHHHAHVLSCLAENELAPPALGVAWDGTGLGLDGTIWGGEMFHVTEGGLERVAHLRRFRLPGGDRAAREPRRAALGLLYEIFGAGAADLVSCLPVELAMLDRGVNAPLTSSAGRLFDGVAAIAGLRDSSSFEGQAAMELEFAVVPSEDAYPIPSTAAPWGEPLVVDWEPLVLGVLADVTAGVATGLVAAKFHNTLAEIILAVARRVGEERVVLSGGCFQNKVLAERSIARLRAEGFRPYWHQRVPPNDGGLALGQIIAASKEVDSCAWQSPES